MFGKTNFNLFRNRLSRVNVLLLSIIIGGLLLITALGLINRSLWVINPVFQMITPSFQVLAYYSFDAINQFSGSSSEAAQFWRSGMLSAAGLIIVMILAPWLLVKGYFAMENSDKQNRLVSVWILGASVIVISIIIAVFQIAVNLVQYNDTKNTVEASRSLDELRMVMMDLGYELSQQFILPSVVDDEIPSDLRLESLHSFREWEQFEIHITELLGDSVLTLTGILSDENLARASPRSAVFMQVTPQKDSLIRFLNSP